MKIRSRKIHGEYQIIVNDEYINKMYNRTQASPIVLASLSHYDKTGFWCLEDIRLLNQANGYCSLGMSTIQTHKPSSSQEHNALIKQLTNYNKKKDIIKWSTFEGIVYPGDKILEIENKQGVPKTCEYSWSLKAGQEQLEKLSQLWENYNENHLDNIAIDNPYRQISDMIFFMQFVENENHIHKKKHHI